MMKFLRKKGVMKILLWGIAIVVILSFGILSNAYLLSEKTASLKYAGKIFGRKISIEQFERSYQFVLIQAQLQYGQNFNQIAPMLKLNDQAWDRIILLHESRRQRISIPDSEVVETIRTIPFFRNQNTGQFDQNIYHMVLSKGLLISSRAFEEGIRDSLKISRLFERQTFTVSTTEEEVATAYQEVNEEVRISYVLFPADDFINEVAFNEIQAKSYFLDHKNAFMQPPAINASYITFPFDSNDPASKNLAYEQAFDTLKILQEGGNLSSAANKHAVAIKETGFFDVNNPILSLGWPLEILKNIPAMRIGQYTDIVTTPNSYDIIQLRERRPAFLPGYEQVKEEVKTAWIKHEAMNQSKAAAEKILLSLQTQNDFEKTTQALGLPVTQTPNFKRGQYLPEIGLAPIFQETAFSLTTDAPLSGVTPTEKGYAILHLDEYLPIDEQKFEEEKQAFGLEILEQKKIVAFNQYFAELKEKATLEDLISEHLK